jgi:hypothetical protein
MFGCGSAKPGGGDDVMWYMDQERINTLANLLRSETLREKMHSREKSGVCSPIGEMESDLVRVKTMSLSDVRAGKRG